MPVIKNLVELADHCSASNPSEDHLIVFREVAIAIAAELIDELSTIHERRVGHGQIDEAIEFNLCRGDVLISPGDMMCISTRRVCISCETDKT